MPFQKGNTLSRGRPKGRRNDRTLQIELLAEKFPNPFELLMKFATGDWKGLGYDSEVYVKEDATGSTTIGYVISPEMRLSATKEACQYLFPKVKHEEPEEELDPLEAQTIEQKKLFLEEAKKELQRLEEEICSYQNAIEAPK